MNETRQKVQWFFTLARSRSRSSACRLHLFEKRHSFNFVHLVPILSRLWFAIGCISPFRTEGTPVNATHIRFMVLNLINSLSFCNTNSFWNAQQLVYGDYNDLHFHTKRRTETGNYQMLVSKIFWLPFHACLFISCVQYFPTGKIQVLVWREKSTIDEYKEEKCRVQ